MFDVAPTELMLVAAVALVVIGPKDLPKAMRVAGRWIAKAQGVARHFRSGLDEMVRQAELEEMEAKWAAENARIMREHPPERTPDPAVEMLPLGAEPVRSTTGAIEAAPAPEVIVFPADPAPRPAPDAAPAEPVDANVATPEPHAADVAVPSPPGHRRA